MSLLGGLSLSMEPVTGQFILTLAHVRLTLIWSVREVSAGVDSLVFTARQPPNWTSVPARIGILLLLASHGFPARWLAIVWRLPLLFYPRPEIPHGAYRFTLLDGGHGLAAVVRTQNHVLRYDAGSRYRELLDARDFAIVPFLKSVGAERID